MPTGFHDCRRKGSENMFVQYLHFQLIYITPPIGRPGYNLERLQFISIQLPIVRYGSYLQRFILTHVPLTIPSWMTIGLS